MGTGIDPKVDFAFKRVFGSEESREILIDLLNAVLADSGFTPVSDVEILNPFSLKDAFDDRLAILDIKARDALGREFLVEMQMLAHKAFRERLLFYLAKDYAQMLGESDDFTRLRPVIVVCFINAVLCPEAPSFHGQFELRDPETGIRFSDHWSVHLIELPKFTKSVNGVTDNLDRWTYFLKHGDELDLDNLPVQLQTSTIRSATGVLTRMSHNTLERDQYEARLKYQRDQSCFIATAREEGWKQGVEEGIERGVEQGVEQGRAEQTRVLILRIGTQRLGQPPAAIVEQLQAMQSLDRLTAMADHILDCPTWDALLAGVPR